MITRRNTMVCRHIEEVVPKSKQKPCSSAHHRTSLYYAKIEFCQNCPHEDCYNGRCKELLNFVKEFKAKQKEKKNENI